MARRFVRGEPLLRVIARDSLSEPPIAVEDATQGIDLIGGQSREAFMPS